MNKDLPDALYTAADLLEGYDRTDPQGFIRSWDFGVFRDFVREGGDVPKNLGVRLRQAEHDAHMAQALRAFMETDKPPRLVGVMGGHGVDRRGPTYRAIVDLCRFLTDQGFTVVTGGGPGAMEAAHVGAAFANSDDAVLNKAIELLAAEPSLPDLSKIVTETGEIA